MTDAAVGIVNPAKTLQKAKRLAKVIKANSKGYSKAAIKPGGCSFTPDTLISTIDGYKTIIEVKKGDIVLSKNDETGEISWREVTDTFKDWHEETITFTVVDENGVEESITTTAEHPFYVDNLGWLAAGNIEVGTIVSGPKFENDITIADIQVNEEPQYAYNFTVDIDHTYFVGKTNIWVHNTCSIDAKPVNGNSAASTKEQHFYMIQDADGNIKKVGVSGQPLNENASSPRANS
ncbi:polymorphic toxin-type HINT domain-containing protein [Pseudoalteromonas rhizosphaerae]|uniref:polymorphic toxin-type HINT domain-containing protein n=1 Tax=Pseudoalteromonas rhizosphaerae TaxID=2518973 RepID=UPI0015D3258B|nr:polymorphic toxin-type HINT domain-containing protein [Pseudoalteromonas rhizosphaerae]